MSNFYHGIMAMDWNIIAYLILSGVLYLAVVGLIDLGNKDASLGYVAMIAAFIPPPSMVFSYFHIWGNIYLTVDIRFIAAVVIFILALFSVNLKGLWGFALALVPILATWFFTHGNFILS